MRKVLYIRLPRTRTRHAGRPKGSTTSMHKRRDVLASVKAVIEEVVAEKKVSIKHALIDGIESGPRDAERYLRLCAEYTDGKPDANLNIRTQFKEDELQQAQRSLTRKMDRLFERAMALEEQTIDVTPAVVR